MNEKLGFMDQQLLKTANRKQQNTDNVLLFVGLTTCVCDYTLLPLQTVSMRENSPWYETMP